MMEQTAGLPVRFVDMSDVGRIGAGLDQRLPQFRFASSSDRFLFGAPGGMQFPDPAHLGNHHFAHRSREKNGMLYTCRAGLSMSAMFGKPPTELLT